MRAISGATHAASLRRAAAAAASFLLIALVFAPGAGAASSQGIQKIRHVVMIMQENRSFDTYFGTYPGANGIPAGTCVKDPVFGGCVKPFYDAEDRSEGGPHGTEAAIADIDGGKMDGFLAQAEEKDQCNETGGCGNCRLTPECADEVLGYHDARDITNYWTYARDFALQDDMFESQASWSLPEHLAMVSAWSALCNKKEPENPMDCLSSLSPANPAKFWSKPVEPGKTQYPWTDLTYLMDKAGVSWRYYIHEGTEPDCEDNEETSCSKVFQNAKEPGIWNPLADFTDVKQDGQLGDIQTLPSFYEAAGQTSECGLPNVSWVVPDLKVSEHPPEPISGGEAYVTTLINTIMRSPCWGSTAIFLSWDDWGGYYDHVVPPDIDGNGYGLRVPGIVISPYSRAGYIDHQQLSHDSYLKFIEDDFLGGARLNPLTDGRPDSRPSVREEAPGLGNLASDFDFEQSPRPPVLLAPEPAPGPSSAPPGGQQPPAVEGDLTTSLTQTSATLNGRVNPDGGEVSDCHFEYGTTTGYGSSVPCSSLPGSGTSPVEASAAVGALSPNATYHFRLVATNPGGTTDGPDLEFTTSVMAPAVETGSASSISQTTATLNATVNPNGSTVTSCHLEYGPTTSYGTSAVCTPSPGSGQGAVAVSAGASGLSPETGYHFRVRATNAGGTSYGLDGGFTTLIRAPTVTGVQPDAGLRQGGTEVTITGSNFKEVQSVQFGSAEASSFKVNSPSSITATAPPGTGTVDVTVENPGGTSASGPADRFTYVAVEAPPTIREIEPTQGPATGGTTVTITGKHFVGVTAVIFGASSASSFTTTSSTSISAVSPAEVPNTVHVILRTPNGSTPFEKRSDFTFVATGSELGGLATALPAW
ncbi:MAG: alkaline phosphatase family protein [Solirubrobacteraceae bacterium]